MADLLTLSAVELGHAYALGTASPVDVAQALIAHVQRWEPHIAATWDFEPEEALAMARQSERRWGQGRAPKAQGPLGLLGPRGPLDGVPVTLKENIATIGRAMPLGSAASALQPATEDAPPAARLREAGAVFLARTTMPDHGMLSSGLSSFHALSRNPWDTRLTPGGSSAGAGAAAAAGYGPIHLGTDIGGSIRLPASWCGVVGYKPSDGRVPIKPSYVGRVAGPLTRTVADAALAMATLSRPDTRDTSSLPPQDLAWTQLPTDPLAVFKGLRVGLLMDAGWGLPLHAEVAQAVQAAARLLAAAGAEVQPLAPFTTREMADGINTFWRMRSWLDIGALPADRRARVLPYIRAWTAQASGYSAAQVFHGYSQIAALREAAVTACRPFDVLLSPVAPCLAFAAEAASPTGDPLRAMEHIAYTLPANMSGQPAISLPCGHSASGLPIGLQFMGQRHDDLGVLRVARAWELLRPAQAIAPWPLLPAAPAAPVDPAEPGCAPG